MKKYKFIPATILFVLLVVPGCELVDVVKVDNPAITQEKLFADATGGAVPLITGLEYAFSDAMAHIHIYVENVSDNYTNTSTFLSSIIDKPREIFPGELDLNDPRDIYFKLQTLRALADFGLTTVLPKDAQATEAQKARAYFFRGLAILLLCENFQAFPLADNGAMVKAEDAIKKAIEDFKTSESIDASGDNGIQVSYALARAYRVAKDKANAVAAANAALSKSTDYVFSATYDPITDPSRAYDNQNLLNYFTVTRPQNDMQPLPRLDFLDPKYPSANSDDPAPVLKTEEIYLILAEAALVDGNLAEAKAKMISAINLAISRPTVSFRDTDARRNRPNADDYKVKADAASAEVSGLVFKRSGSTVTCHPISYTHLREADIQVLSTQAELFSTLYLLRQEIFFSEGRRMSDLGIRLPIMQTQIEANPNINDGDYGTSVYVPAYIPQGKEMDLFTMDAATKVCTINYDMNKILAQNMNSVSPFLK